MRSKSTHVFSRVCQGIFFFTFYHVQRTCVHSVVLLCIKSAENVCATRKCFKVGYPLDFFERTPNFSCLESKKGGNAPICSQGSTLCKIFPTGKIGPELTELHRNIPCTSPLLPPDAPPEVLVEGSVTFPHSEQAKQMSYPGHRHFIFQTFTFTFFLLLFFTFTFPHSEQAKQMSNPGHRHSIFQTFQSKCTPSLKQL